MSHFTVAVIHEENQDIEELLYPYFENLDVEEYVYMDREEAIRYARDNYFCKEEEECFEKLAELGYTLNDKGEVLSTYNPDAKWDWYQIGGRWSGEIRTKDGLHTDEARLGDIDFSQNEETYQNALRFWEVIVEHQPRKEGEEYFSVYKEEYYIDRYKSKEAYAKEMASFSTFAVITPDGAWHEPGTMGWFGISSASPDDERQWHQTYYERFIKDADPDLILTLVDCHI